MNLPIFSPSLRVTAETAKFDLIEIEIGEWIIQGIPNDIANFFKFLGPYPERLEAQSNLMSSQTRPVTPDRFGWMFNRHSGENEQISKVKLRGSGRGSGSNNDRLLASGDLQVRSIPCSVPGEVRKRLRLDLSLNPTRFVRHQMWPTRMGRPVEDWDWPDPIIRTGNQSTPPSPESEIALDGKDNVLLSARNLSLARPEAWPYHVRRYFEAFESAINAEFARAFDEADLALFTGRRIRRPTTHYNLNLVESYWEFQSANPTREVRRLEPILFPLGMSTTSRDYPHGLAQSGLDENSRSILIALPRGRSLRVYAKTNKRIRFEVIHDLSKPSVCQLLNPYECRKTTERLDEVLTWLDCLAQDAATCLNEILGYIEAHALTVEPSAPTYELIFKIAATVQNEARAETILSLLVEDGCVRMGRGGSPLLEDVRKLRRKGILEQHFRSDVVTPYYREALTILRQQAGVIPS